MRGGRDQPALALPQRPRPAVPTLHAACRDRPLVRSWRPALDADTGRLSWPCIILYPEAGSQDQIQAWDEQDTVGAQLDQVRARRGS